LEDEMILKTLVTSKNKKVVLNLEAVMYWSIHKFTNTGKTYTKLYMMDGIRIKGDMEWVKLNTG
jgi:hypothetical protein